LTNTPKIEVCCYTLASVLIAEKAGADRVELCMNYLEGGTTPSFGLIKSAISNTSIPLHVIIRPRGGDFYYSQEEFEIMKQDILLCRELGVQGVVLGLLSKDGQIDIHRTVELIEIARPMSLTFHRAFDKVAEPLKALEDCINMGIDRILTSGLKQKAPYGIHLLKKLVEKAKDQIIIMPGSGLHSGNIGAIHKKLNASEYHLSAKKFIQSEMHYQNDDVCFSDHPDLNDHTLIEADFTEIQKVLSELRT
jgi:copper homeostasis protein